jgi:hypothetical protein
MAPNGPVQSNCRIVMLVGAMFSFIRLGRRETTIFTARYQCWEAENVPMISLANLYIYIRTIKAQSFIILNNTKARLYTPHFISDRTRHLCFFQNLMYTFRVSQVAFGVDPTILDTLRDLSHIQAYYSIELARGWLDKILQRPPGDALNMTATN